MVKFKDMEFMRTLEWYDQSSGVVRLKALEWYD